MPPSAVSEPLSCLANCWAPASMARAGAGRLGQPQGHVGGRKAPPGAFEQHHTQLLLQLCNVSTDGRLAGLHVSGCPQEAAMLQSGQERLNE